MEHYMRTSTLEILFGQFEIIRTQDFGDLIKSTNHNSALVLVGVRGTN